VTVKVLVRDARGTVQAVIDEHGLLMPVSEASLFLPSVSPGAFWALAESGLGS